jgi:hypothetical protein
MANLGRVASRELNACLEYFTVIASEAKQSNLRREEKRKLDCFAEPVIGRAFARPVGSQ